MDLHNISQEEFELIEAYLNDNLSENDTTAFNKKLKDEPDFRDKVEEVKTIISGIETQAMKEHLEAFHKALSKDQKQATEPQPKVRSISWKKIAIAAVFIIAAGSFWFLREDTNERLYKKYFKPDPGLPTTMSTTNNYKFNKAMVNYKLGNYNKAITDWKTLLEKKPQNDTLNYFIGVAYLANGNEKDAISFLEKSIKNENFSLIKDSHYYLGLAQLKIGNIEAAKSSFAKSSSVNGKKILESL